MRRVMLVGRTGCGKTTFCQALLGLERRERKTQAVEFMDAAIDTPGEYLENRRFFRALSVTAVEADAVVFMQDCVRGDSLFPPGFAVMFMGLPVYGVVSKIDCGTPVQIREAERILRDAGAAPIFPVNCRSGDGIEAVAALLAGDGPAS